MATYKVKKGDTLSKIAKAHNTTIEKLQKLNPHLIKNVNKISVGWVLTVPFSVESTSNRCQICEAFKQALNDINKLKSVKTLESLIEVTE